MCAKKPSEMQTCLLCQVRPEMNNMTALLLGSQRHFCEVFKWLPPNLQKDVHLIVGVGFVVFHLWNSSFSLLISNVACSALCKFCAWCWCCAACSRLASDCSDAN
jgi:hypothetical protein